MRTTIDLDAPLLARAKRRAAQRGLTLSHLVREAVSNYLAEIPSAPEDGFELITCGEPGGYCPTPGEMAEADEIDEARLNVGGARADA